jgi:hypothetical protein
MQVFSTRLFPRLVRIFSFGFLALFAQVGQAADELKYFKNYFVTGDYVVGGVGLWQTGVGGWATGTINMSGTSATPDGADIVAAFLYWETVENTPYPPPTPGTPPPVVKGYFRSKEIVGAVVGDKNCPACWGPGKGAPASTTGGPWVRVYRADVLRYLEVDKVRNVRIANGSHTVKLKDSGLKDTAPLTEGASLVVVYRVLSLTQPLKAVVIYDGALSGFSIDQTVGGFYQALAGPARMTHIVGDRRSSSKETLLVDGLVPVGVDPTNPFSGQGYSWDNLTFPISLPTNAASVRTQMVPIGGSDTDCLSWAAIVTSTNVMDSDGDGLLDIWETQWNTTPARPGGMHLSPGDASTNTAASFGTCFEHPAQCVDLYNMGARNGQKDIFVEIDWLRDGDKHEHKPKLLALSAVAATFANRGIVLHFDVGNNNYQGSGGFIVPAPYAKGGDVVEESSLVCSPSNVRTCTFPDPPNNYSVMGWKIGFRAIKEGFPVLNLSPRFERNRKDIFHYALFGHALGIPFDPHTGVPKSVSGVADRPGGDFMVTLGLWRSDIATNDQVGSDLAQAGTIMHELGHNLGLSHAGVNRTPTCMSNYPSIMNYLYQARGLTGTINGLSHIDYSSGTLSPLNENSLSEPWSDFRYRLRYYGPHGSGDPPDSAAKLHCDGTEIKDGARMIRLENSYPGFIDWNHDTISTPGVLPSLDVNFNGQIGDGLADFNDWGNLNLRQVGARMNVSGLSTDVGQADLGQADLGQADLGQADLGQADLGQADLGQADLGQADLGQADLGELDYDTVVLSTIDPPPPYNNLACPTCGLQATSTLDRITLSWTAPETGQIQSYKVYRSGALLATLSRTSGGPPPLTYDDVVNGTTTLYNTSYNYYVTSNVLVGTHTNESGPSTPASGIVKHLFVTAPSLSRVYGEPNPVFPAPSTSGQAPDGLTGATDCTTAATSASPVGPYKITCTGLTPAAGVTYADGTLTITPRALTITANNQSKTYGMTFTFSGNEFTTSGLLNPPDTVTSVTLSSAGAPATATVDGSPYLIVPSAAVGSGLDNYSITYSAGLLSVAMATTTTTISSGLPDPSIVGKSVTFTVVVSPVYGGTMTGTVTVTDSDANSVNCPVTSVAGTYSCTLTPTVVGIKTLTARYSGDTNYKPSSGTASLRVTYEVIISPPKSTAKLGSSVPVNFQVKNGLGVVITDLSVVKLIESVFNGSFVSGACVSASPIRETLYDIPHGSTGKSSLRAILSPPGFQFNWDTTTAGTMTPELPIITGPGCYTVAITLTDGAAHASSTVVLQQ